MSLEEFCKAINVPNVGSWEEIPRDSDASLRDFWRSISVDAHMNIHRGKLSTIQHPGLRYFVLFLVRGFLARKNTTPCTGPIIHLLRCAKEGIYGKYNLGVILARTFSYVVAHNESKSIYSGAISTMVFEYIKEEKKLGEIGTEILESNLLDFDMLFKMGILVRAWDNNFVKYRYMVRENVSNFTMLPRLEHWT
jgi:hypothetical protein